MAVANYESAEGHFPPPYILGPDGKPWHSWRVLLLPYIGAEDVFKQYNMNEPWNGPNNSKLAAKMPRIYRFHHGTEPDTVLTNYVAVVGEQTVWHPSKKIVMKDITDGTSQTALIVEHLGTNIHWMEPRDLNFNEMDFRVNNPAGFSSPYTMPGLVTVDDCTLMINPKTSADVFRAMLTIAGKELLQQGDNGWEVIQDGRLRPLANLKP